MSCYHGIMRYVKWDKAELPFIVRGRLSNVGRLITCGHGETPRYVVLLALPLRHSIHFAIVIEKTF